MGIIIDLILIAFILLCVFYGYKKGLVKLGLKLVSFLIAIVITFILYRPLSDIVIINTSIDETIQNAIINKMQEEESTNLVENAKDNIVKGVARAIII